MNCISINVCGIGEDYKVEWVRRLKTQHRASFVGIQETQLVNVNDRDVAGCWGSIDFSYSAIQSQVSVTALPREKEGFDNVFASAWLNFKGYGTPDYYLVTKLKFLKNKLKKWRANEYPKETVELKRIKQQVHDIDCLAERRQLSELEMNDRRSGIHKIIEMEKLLTLDLKQKSRIKWVIDGDENTSFFHGYVNNKLRKSRIMGLQINGSWTTNVETIKQEAFKFYQRKFLEKWPSRPKLFSNKFNPLDAIDKAQLEAPFTREEIRRAVWACGNEKAPGPDGFSF
ncbi:hypothetical protein Lser_V15G44766 [Lactuca serriola]